MRIVRRLIQTISFIFLVVLLGRATFPLNFPIPPELYSLISPLSFINTSIAIRIVVWSLAFALILLASGFFLGRAFCGWLCPFGAIIDFFDWLLKPLRKLISKPLIRWGRWLKYAVLGLTAGGVIIGLNLTGVIDPLSLLPRSLVLGVSPYVQKLTEWLLCIWAKLPFISDKTYEIREFIRWEVLYFEMPSFPSTLFLIILGGVLALGIFARRGFCRWLCPLGALLGLCGRWAPIRRYADLDTCIECGVCPSRCRTSAIDEDGKSHNQSECVLCLDCKYECGKRSIHFLPRRDIETAQVKYGISRRRFLYAMGSGVVAGVALAYSNGIFNKQKIKKHIRPPGVIRGSGFEERCIKCGECMKVCPTGGLQPVTSTNLEDLWTPELVPRIGYCEFNCNMCAQICPTKAIPEMSLEEKQRFKLGTSRIDRKRCISWVENAHCGVCEEHCPVSPKAIVLIESEGGDVLLPVVRSGFCIGCGQCEHVCPVEGKSAIVVMVEGAGTYAGGGGGLGKGNRRGKS